MHKQQGAFPLSSPAFDWTISVMGALVMAGVIQDGWAHNHGLVDQSFMTPWHAMLYGMMGLTGLVLGFFAIKHKREGYPVARALPRGYWMALAGVILFIAGGLLDLVWHTLYGIEVNINALVSPTHLILALGGALVFAGPLRSIAYQYGPDAGGWTRIGPAAVSIVASLTLLGFFTAYAQLIGDETTARVIGRNRGAPVVSNAYVMRADGSAQTRLTLDSHDDVWGAAASPDGKHIVYRSAAGGAARNITQLSGADASRPSFTPDGHIVFSATGRPPSVHTQLASSFAEDANVIESLIVAGLLLLLVRRWRAPLGSMTFVLGLFAFAMATQSDNYYVVPAVLLIGIAADVYLATFGDRARSGRLFYTFAFDVTCLLFAGFLLSVAIHSRGLGWQPNLVFGSPIIAGFVGLLVAFCYDPPLRAA